MNHFIKKLIFITCMLASHLSAMEMMIFDVGQGSCAVVKDADRGTLIVDAGTKMLNRGTADAKIATIADYAALGSGPITIVVSHGEQDHYGWIPKIAARLRAQKKSVSLILGGTANDYKTQATSQTPKKKLVELKGTVHGKYADECTFEELSALLPAYCTLIAAPTNGGVRDVNARSIVLKIQGVLLPADSTGSIITNAHNHGRSIQSKVLVAAHHGADSAGSNSQELLDTVGPEIILISASTKDKHPRAEFIKRAISCLKEKERSTWHLITLYNNANEQGLDDELKIFMVHESGYHTGLTNYPMFSTMDMGDIALEFKDQAHVTIRFPNNLATEGTPTAIMIKSINAAYHSDVIKIDLSASEMTDPDIMILDALPKNLKEIILDENPLTIEALCYLVLIAQEHQSNLALSVKKIPCDITLLLGILQEPPLVINLLRWLYTLTLEKSALPEKATAANAYQAIVSAELLKIDMVVKQQATEPNIPEALFAKSHKRYRIATKTFKKAFTEAQGIVLQEK